MITRFTDKQKKHINKLEVIQYKNSKLTIHLNYLQLQKKNDRQVLRNCHKIDFT